MDPAEHLHARFLARCAARDFPTGPATATDLAADEIIALFRSQCTSRHLDLTSRRMQKAGQGFYTIGSSGHEGMAAVAHALDPTDMAFLHYRDAAFQIHRAGQVPEQDPIHDILLSFAAAKADPMSGGRHKVLGSRALMIPPQTSTIASHLPKAVGAAYAIGLARRRAPEHEVLQRDGIVICSFDRARGVQLRRLDRVPERADAASFRLRGQWHRHFGADPQGLDRGVLRHPAGVEVFRRRRARPLRHRPDGPRSGAICARHAAPGVSAPAHGASAWPCRLGC